MAGLPLNTFKSVPLPVTTTLQTIYTAPLGITSIVLMAQVSNVAPTEPAPWVSFMHYSYGTGITTYIVFQATVPPNDALILLGGKLVLQTGDQISIIGSSNGEMQFISSILETANQ
jgi:hypothetical protein